MKHLGDYDAGGTLFSKFTTYRPSTGAPFTLAGTPALSVYKDGSTTQSTAGITLTTDFDGVAGLHHVAIDTSADGTFYSAGSHFEIVITTGTVDSVSVVGSCVASFSLRKDSALKPTVAARTLDVSATGEAGLDWANIGSPTTAVNLSATNIDVDQVVASVSGAVGSVTGNVGGNVNGSVGSVASGGITATSIAADAIGASELAADAVTEIAGAVWAVATRELTSGANIVLAKGVGVTGFNDLDAAGVRSAVGLASANLDTQIAAVQSDTNDIQTRIPAALVSGRIDASVGAMAANTLTASALATDAVTEIQTGLSTLDAAGIRTAVGLATANLDTQLDALPTAAENATAVWGAGARTLTALDEDSTTLDLDATIRAAVGLASANLDTQIGTLATGANLATVAGYLDTEIAAILADTNELQTDWANGGRLDLILDARASQASVDTIDTNVDAILVDTAEIGAAGAGLTALASAANLATLTGYVDTEVAAIKATTDKLDATLELSSDGQIFTAAALQNAPSSGGGLDAAGVRAAVGLASANLDTQLAAIDTKTTNLPSDPADQSLIIAATTSIANLIGTPAGVSLAADVAAVQSDTNDLQSRLPAALISGRIDATVGAMQADVLTSTALAASAVTEIQTGLSTLDAAGVRSAVGLAAANLDTQLAAIDDAIDTEVGAIKATTDKLDPTLENSSDGWIFTAAALQQVPAVTVPTAADVADAVWDEPIASHAAVSGSTAEALNAAGASGDPWVTALPGAYTAGQAGYLLGTNLDATVSSRASAADLATVAGYLDTEVAAIKAVTDKLDGTLELSSDGQIFTAAALQNAPSSSGLDAAGVRAAIGLASANLDTQLADLPTNAELSTALASSDDAVLAVLGTPAGASLAADVAAVQADTNDIQGRLPAALISGRIDATVGAMQANVMTAAAAAADLTTELQSGLATASALTTVEGKIDTIDTVVDAILVDTAEIGVAGAGLTALASAANLATVAGYLDTEIAAIKAKTDALPASPAATGDIPSAATIADAVHDEVIEGTTTLRQSIRLHNSALGGKVVGLDTFNPVFRDLADTKDVIDATVDTYGNRSAVTRDLT